MPSAVVSKEGPQHSHPIKLKICLVCHFDLAKSQRVWFAVQRGKAHSYSTSNEDPKSTKTASRAHISKELWTYKILYTPKSSQKLSTPPISSCLSLNDDPFMIDWLQVVPSSLLTVVVQAFSHCPCKWTYNARSHAEYLLHVWNFMSTTRLSRTLPSLGFHILP